ncbi:ankyrin [Piromyces finnis]|uniref:Ankyrin n=1 Tax=Piromyces finnis TaxID=1754191 RepID=A0A1Y1VIN9_9FUNG|nr:ankyrin [Piromyces finnis]|eukprot:ORX57198.1 ankyrin [Piromyces finnis]
MRINRAFGSSFESIPRETNNNNNNNGIRFSFKTEKRNKIIDYIKNDDLSGLKSYIEDDANNVHLDQLNIPKKFDFIINAIQQNASNSIIQYLLQHPCYNSINIKIPHIVHTDTPLFTAIANNRFDLADLFIANYNLDINQENDIIEDLNQIHLLNYKNLRYILRHGYDKNNITNSMIKSLISQFPFLNKCLNIIFEHFIFDNTFILNLLTYYKNNKPLSKDSLNGLINNEKGKIKFDSDIYKFAIANQKYAYLKVLFENDSSSMDTLIFRTLNYDLLKYAIKINNLDFVKSILNYNIYSFKNILSELSEGAKFNCNVEIQELLIKTAYKIAFSTVYGDRDNDKSITNEVINDDDTSNNESPKNISNNTSTKPVTNVSVSEDPVTSTKPKITYSFSNVLPTTFDQSSQNNLNNNLNDTSNNNNNNKEKENDSDYVFNKHINCILNTVIKTKNINLVKYLMENDEFRTIDLNINDINEEYTINAALQSNDPEIVEYLLKHGADSNTKNLNGNTLLSQAIQNNQYDIVKCLLDYNVNVMEKDVNNNYPLIKAIHANNLYIIQLLIMYGIKNKIDLNCLDVNGNTPLTLAYRHGYFELFRVLAKFLNINMKDCNGNTPLYYAILNNDEKIINDLCTLGADVNYRNNDGYSILDIALTSGNKNIFLTLLKQANTIQLNESNQKAEALIITIMKTQLSLYTINDKIIIIKQLIGKGANINAVDTTGNYTPLVLAVQNRSLELVKLLIENGANVNFVSKNSSMSILMLAINIGEIEIVKYLLKCNANVNYINSAGKSPLKNALKQENHLIFLTLAKTNIKSIKGNLLIPIIRKGNLKVLKELINYGLDIDTIVENGNTLLAQAIIDRQVSIVDYLVDNGANVFSVNSHGNTIMDLCRNSIMNSNNNVYIKIQKLCG